jgi:hypothetical protein
MKLIYIEDNSTQVRAMQKVAHMAGYELRRRYLHLRRRASLRTLCAAEPASGKRADTGTWGVLKLTLHSDSYSWHFVPVKGKTFTDVGFAPCVTNAPSAMP